jgi:hypothetical protein
MPAGQAVQLVALGSGAMYPEAHAVHRTAVLPGVGLAVPAPQAVQLSAAVVLPVVPAGQNRQAGV